MKEYSHIEVSLDDRGVLAVSLNRPSTGNALDSETVLELLDVFDQRPVPEAYRLVVLRGNGPVFSSGNDAAWLQRMQEAEPAQNRVDATNLATMLDALDGFARPVVAAVHGRAAGEALGLVAACDVVIAEARAVFQSPEVCHGLVPACVAPFLVAKAGQSHARDLLLTGREFDATHAKDVRLVHEIVPSARDLDGAVARTVEGLLRGAPRAQREIKSLIRRLTFHGHSVLTSNTLEDIAAAFGESRRSPEAREGLAARHEHRDPLWLKPE
jgi:methylglutaconyl-CoA hydratase